MSVTITLNETEARDAVIALDKHSRYRETKGQNSAARKYADLSDSIRDQSDRQLPEGLFNHTSDTANTSDVLPDDVEDAVREIVEQTLRGSTTNNPRRIGGE